MVWALDHHLWGLNASLVVGMQSDWRLQRTRSSLDLGTRFRIPVPLFVDRTCVYLFDFNLIIPYENRIFVISAFFFLAFYYFY